MGKKIKISKLRKMCIKGNKKYNKNYKKVNKAKLKKEN